MRSALWILILFAAAVAAALFLNSNRATITLFWQPYRMDMSLNLFLLLLATAFAACALVIYALTSVWRMPTEAKIWREYRHDVAAHQSLVRTVEALSQGDWQDAEEEALRLQQLSQTALSQEHHPAHAHTAKEVQEHQRLLALSYWLEKESRRAKRESRLDIDSESLS